MAGIKRRLNRHKQQIAGVQDVIAPGQLKIYIVFAPRLQPRGDGMYLKFGPHGGTVREHEMTGLLDDIDGQPLFVLWSPGYTARQVHDALCGGRYNRRHLTMGLDVSEAFVLDLTRTDSDPAAIEALLHTYQSAAYDHAGGSLAAWLAGQVGQVPYRAFARAYRFAIDETIGGRGQTSVHNAPFRPALFYEVPTWEKALDHD